MPENEKRATEASVWPAHRVNPDELVKVEDVYGESHFVLRRSLLNAGRWHRGPFLFCHDEDGREIEGKRLHFANIRKEPVGAERKALEELFPMVDHLAMCASAEGNGDCVTINYDYANQMLLLIVCGLREGEGPKPLGPAEASRSVQSLSVRPAGQSAAPFLAERLGEGVKV